MWGEYCEGQVAWSMHLTASNELLQVSRLSAGCTSGTTYWYPCTCFTPHGVSLGWTLSHFGRCVQDHLELNFQTGELWVVVPSLGIPDPLIYLLAIFFLHKEPCARHARQLWNGPGGTNIYSCCWDLWNTHCFFNMSASPLRVDTVRAYILNATI